MTTLEPDDNIQIHFEYSRKEFLDIYYRENHWIFNILCPVLIEMEWNHIWLKNITHNSPGEILKYFLIHDCLCIPCRVPMRATNKLEPEQWLLGGVKAKVPDLNVIIKVLTWSISTFLTIPQWISTAIGQVILGIWMLRRDSNVHTFYIYF